MPMVFFFKEKELVVVTVDVGSRSKRVKSDAHLDGVGRLVGAVGGGACDVGRESGEYLYPPQGGSVEIASFFFSCQVQFSSLQNCELNCESLCVGSQLFTIYIHILEFTIL